MRASSRLGVAALCAAVTWLALALVFACSTTTHQAGGLELIIDTDLTAPDDFDVLRVQVSQVGAQELLDFPYSVFAADGAPGLSLPATLAIASGSSSNQEAAIQVQALKGGAGGTVVVTLDALVQVPKDRVAQELLFLAKICKGITCNPGFSCQPQTGMCAETKLDTTPPPFTPDATLVPHVAEGGQVGEVGQNVEAGQEDTPSSDAGGCPAMDTACDACVANDIHNCGACGHDCTGLPHVSGNLSCGDAGQCSYTCAPGWAHCTDNPDDGCETDITMPAHCGACQSSCSAGMTCQSGICCPANTHNCGGTCQSNTSTTTCGMTCNSPCPAPPSNGIATCNGATCGILCNSGYTLCGGTCANEQSDNGNCGACGTQCQGGMTCQIGVCNCPPGNSHCVATPDGGNCISAPCATLKVQMEQPTSGANTIPVDLNITNTSSAAVDLAIVSVHYYFTADGDTSLAFNCDYAGPYMNNVVTFSSANVSAAFVPLGAAATMYADTYLELSFTSASLPAGDTVSVNFRIHDATLSVNFNQANDWSHQSTLSATTYNDADFVTAYVNGTLAWGIEP